MKILVAMSGGVDSSVVAHMLKEQGHDLIGCMMKLWTDPLAPAVRRAVPTKCCSVEHIARARSVCETLKTPFYVMNLEEEFKTKVVDPFLRSYERGETPNPCIACNRHVKFGALLQRCKELGCDALATGHYARIARERMADGEERMLLLEAEDSEKDQSYYLYTLSQDDLRRVLFPLGNLRKQEVYALASKFGVPIPETYRESQDLCFFPEKNVGPFLRRYISSRPGPIQTCDGRTLGTHDGVPFYTIGQRRRLNIGGQRIPLHVVAKDTRRNILTVAPWNIASRISLRATKLHWVSSRPEEDTPLHIDARVHSLGERHRGILIYRNQKGSLTFTESVRGIAPGQSVVLYRRKEVIGGGVISD